MVSFWDDGAKDVVIPRLSEEPLLFGALATGELFTYEGRPYLKWLSPIGNVSCGLPLVLSASKEYELADPAEPKYPTDFCGICHPMGSFVISIAEVVPQHNRHPAG